MSRKSSRKEDHRVLVLLSVCIVICLLHLGGVVRPEWEKTGEPQLRSTMKNVVWLEADGIPEGLYRLPQEDEFQNELEFSTKAGTILRHARLSGIPLIPLSTIRFTDGIIQVVPAPHPEAASFFFLPFSINEADAELLTTVPGIGPELADRIICFRNGKGRINELNELLKVTGIGEKKLEILSRYVTI